MANPSLRFNNLTGSDSAASGAGPATAVSGTAGRNVAAGSTQVGFFDASDPNLSTVAVDGSAVLWVKGAASGQKFAKITAKKATAQNVTGTTLAGNTSVTVSSSSGMTAGTLVRIASAGAGGGDYYGLVSSVPDSTHIVVSPAPDRYASNVAVKNPCQVTIENSLAITTGGLWAIGGKRRTLNHADSDDLLLADAKPGWRVQIEPTASPYQGGVTINTPGSSAEAIVLEAVDANGAPALAEITTSGTVPTLILGANANRWRFSGLKLSRTGTDNDPVVDQQGVSSFGFSWDRCEFLNGSTGGADCVGYRIAAASSPFLRLTFRECAFHDCRSGWLRYLNAGTAQTWGISFYNCSFYGLSAGAIGMSLTRIRGVSFWGCIFFDYEEEAVAFLGDATGDCSFAWVHASIFDGNGHTSTGLDFSKTQDGAYHWIVNCVLVRHWSGAVNDLSYLGYNHDFYRGFNSVGETVDWVNSTAYGVFDVWDNVEDVPVGWNNNAGPPRRVDIDEYDPGFVEAELGEMNYSLGPDAIVDIGYPVHAIGAGWDSPGSSTRSWWDIGVCQQLNRVPIFHFTRKVT